jgi:hypothetical protein
MGTASQEQQHPYSGRRGILLWHHGRCGSSVLSRLLDQHPDISWHRELYRRYTVKGIDRPNFLDDIHRVRAKSTEPFYGIELKGLPSQHLQRLGVDLERFVDAIRPEGFEHAIFLHRRNILRKLISVQIVDQGLRDSFQLAADSADELKGKLTIDVNQVRIVGRLAPLLDMIEYIDTESQKAQQVLAAQFDLLSLYYEDDIEQDPLDAYAKVCAYLGLPPADAHVLMKRINTKPLGELVTNAGEIEDMLAGTPYEWMLTA